MTTATTTRRLMRTLAAPMIKWPEKIARLNQLQRRELDDAAAQMAQLAARLSAYLARVDSAGHTKRGKVPPNVHRDAVRRQNTAAKKVRRALGYTYTRPDIHF